MNCVQNIRSRHYNLAKSFALLVLLTITINTLLAYDNPVFAPLPQRNLQYTYRLGWYDLSSNPAFFGQNYPENISSYQLRFNYQENPYHRVFDPAFRSDYRLWSYNLNYLSQQTLIGAFIDYRRSDLRKMYRSLEKDFYAEYFALADTTTGKTTYDGPQVGFIYHYQPNKILTTGLQLQYGVEHGIKDVFTKCETIMRNIDLNLGTALNLFEQRLSLGFYGRYYNSQRKYEAVKELQDAQVKTYFGYHVYKLENPRSTNRKNDEREGYEFGGQLILRRLGLSDLTALFTASKGAQSGTVSVGSTSSPEKRGYSQTEGRRYTCALIYAPSSRSYLNLLFQYAQQSTWVEAANFRVIILENNPIVVTWRLSGVVPLYKRLQFGGLFEWQVFKDDYQEYIQPFQVGGQRQAWSTSSELRWQVNPIISSFLNVQLRQEEPFFYWYTSQIQTLDCELGLERLGLWGLIGFGLELGWERFDTSHKINRSIGFNLNYRR